VFERRDADTTGVGIDAGGSDHGTAERTDCYAPGTDSHACPDDGSPHATPSTLRAGRRDDGDDRTRHPRAHPLGVFQTLEQRSSDTVLVGVLNDDGTIRAIDALSTAEGISDDFARGMAQLEALVLWSTLGRAANPRLSEAEGSQLLTQIGLPGGAAFGTLDPAVLDLKGVRYYIIEGDTTTNFIARQPN
jgi:hypothetical protein